MNELKTKQASSKIVVYYSTVLPFVEPFLEKFVI